MRLILLIILIAMQSVCYSQVDTLFIRNSINKIENDNKKLNQKIDDLTKDTDLQNELSKKIIDSLKNKISAIESNNNKLAEDNKNLKNDFYNEKNFKDRDLENISSKFNTSNVIGIIITIIIVIVLVFFIIIIIRKFKEANKTVEEKALKFDKELLDLMSKQLNLLRDTERDIKEGKDLNEPDHSFAIKVADEINRISMRLGKMDDNSRDVQAVRNALKRMERELNQQGYEIIIRNGEEYKDTMTFLPVNFVAVEGLKTGEQKIHRTIKPQIVYKSELIQQGEIEVGVNESDLV